MKIRPLTGLPLASSAIGTLVRLRGKPNIAARPVLI
jgi:hypothetical protein